MEDGAIEAAMVGRDGIANGTSALDDNVSLHECIVQISGAGSAIAPQALRSAARRFEPLQSLIIRHEQVLLAQAMQSAACNASHTVEERMCRWLHDLTQSDQLTITQDYLAHLIGVRRTTVSDGGSPRDHPSYPTHCARPIARRWHMRPNEVNRASVEPAESDVTFSQRLSCLCKPRSALRDWRLISA
jgi:DNA-binding XRE family transcriptional regulator